MQLDLFLFSCSSRKFLFPLAYDAVLLKVSLLNLWRNCAFVTIIFSKWQYSWYSSGNQSFINANDVVFTMFSIEKWMRHSCYKMHFIIPARQNLTVQQCCYTTDRANFNLIQPGIGLLIHICLNVILVSLAQNKCTHFWTITASFPCDGRLLSVDRDKQALLL